MALQTPSMYLTNTATNKITLSRLYEEYAKKTSGETKINKLVTAFKQSYAKTIKTREQKREYKETTKKPIQLKIGTPALHWEVMVYGLPLEFVNEIMVQTFENWVSFAMGGYGGGVGAKALKNPTGAYAKSISLKKKGNTIELFSKSPIADIIESGRRGFNLAQRMEAHGAFAVKPVRWLRIPGGKKHRMPSYFYLKEQPRGLSVELPGAQGGSAAIAKRQQDRGAAKLLPISANSIWMIPPMKGHNIAGLLSQRLETQLNRIR